MVDVTDSKSVGGDTVWVRVPPPAPIKDGYFDRVIVLIVFALK
mgnify:CR=1 FL=1